MSRTSLLVIGIASGSIALAHAARAAADPVVAMNRPEEPAPQTLLSGPVAHGGFGGPVLSYTTLDGEPALLVGGRGGWLINHRLVIGGGGYGVTNRVAVPAGSTPSDADHQLTFGYGGLWTEYVVVPSRLVHGALGVLVGGGGLSYQRFRPKESQGTMVDDAVFVVEPTLSLELNVVSFMRVCLFASTAWSRAWTWPGSTIATCRGSA